MYIGADQNTFEPGQVNRPLVSNGFTKTEELPKTPLGKERASWKRHLFKNRSTFKKDKCKLIVSAILIGVAIGFLALLITFIANLLNTPKIHIDEPSGSHRLANAGIGKPDSPMTTDLPFDEPTPHVVAQKAPEKQKLFSSTTISAEPVNELTSALEEITSTSTMSELEDSTHPLDYFGLLTDRNSADDCLVHYSNGAKTGVYPVVKESKRIEVFCDMETENGGWTVIQRRLNNKESFHNKLWNQYVEGFGNKEENFWIGLENLYALAPSSGDYVTLRIELRGDTCFGDKCSKSSDGFWYNEYKFKIGDASSGYQLDISTPTRGNLSTANNPEDPLFAMNNGQKFTTIDHDQDSEPGFNCAQFRNYGPWWHKNCTKVALNGLYGDKKPVTRYMMWNYVEKSKDGKIVASFPIHPKETIMLIRPMF
ncbi:unnamed protein product [Caenorhabditis bovis]|uniref:Fibrinogen C-terminal domain-containing protein n=1 Tax=Caenorhabditis bovis TaxID=2654633 RepID=A0A8S1EPA9_9PELO|nr:unnamed protein product [Caenorhabditis bovis]